jgi:DNA (cytosine-5)-methyltransferase 1
MKRSSELRRLRERAGYSQEQLATVLGYSRRTILRWEAGDAVPRDVVWSRLRDLLKNNATAHADSAAEFTFIDLFAGIGGIRLGFERAGGRCLFTSEIDRFCQTTYQANYGSDRIYGDIRATETQAAIPHHDVLVAGFPCQPFSLAGVSKKNSLGRPHGFACETQGTLFYDIAEIIRTHQPRAFLLENVKNLRSHDKGRTFDVIMKVLREELGYWVPEPRIIDASRFVPQHRERIFIAGFREPCDFSWDDVEIPEEGPRLGAILHSETEPEEAPYTYRRNGKTLVHERYTLSDHLWGYLQAYAEKHRQKGNGFGFGLVGPEDTARTLSARYHKDGSEILVKQSGRNPRRLTPRECARLMGFDSTRSTFRLGQVSDTQAYRQFGNAVVVPVVERIAAAMKPYVSGSEQLALPLRKSA